MKKIAALTLSVLMLAAFAAAMASDLPLIAPISAELPALEPYQPFTGIIVDITPAGQDEAWFLYHVRIESEEHGVIVFVITQDSLNENDGELQIGGTFTGWIDTARPVIAIYPPQYTAVSYQTGDASDDGGAAEWAGAIDWASIPVMVNGGEIELPFPPYANGWTVMVPLRAAAEALGYTVTWDNAARSVRLDVLNDDGVPYIGRAVSLTIGMDAYSFVYARIAPFQLGAAPELTNSTTYVPLSFFRTVLGMNNAHFFEGLIEINDDEPMEDDMR
jgi:hypothetical protein